MNRKESVHYITTLLTDNVHHEDGLTTLLRTKPNIDCSYGTGNLINISFMHSIFLRLCRITAHLR